VAPTELQRNRLRRNVGATGANMPADVIDDYYVQANGKYSGNTSAIEACVRILAIRDLRALAVKDVDYDQNDASEKLSQVFANLSKLESTYAGELDMAVADASSSVRWGALAGGRPRKRREWPDA